MDTENRAGVHGGRVGNVPACRSECALMMAGSTVAPAGALRVWSPTGYVYLSPFF